MISIREFTVEGLAAIDVQAQQAGELSSNIMLALPEDVLRDWSRIVYEDERPIAGMGCFPLWEGVGQGWAWLSEEALSLRPVAITRIARRLSELAREKGKFRRIQVDAPLHRPESVDWAEALGFTAEGRMRNYGVGGVGDHIMYSRCW